MKLTAIPSPLAFVHILDLPTVYGNDNRGPKISFTIQNEEFLTTRLGIHLLVQASTKEILFCGMGQTRSFRNNLLFNNPNDPHFHNSDRIREEVGKAINESGTVEVHAQTEDTLRTALQNIGYNPADLLTLNEIKKALINLFNPPWNRRR